MSHLVLCRYFPQRGGSQATRLDTFKNNTDQAYSCPKNLPKQPLPFGSSENPPVHRSAIVLMYLRRVGVLNWASILPRDCSLSDSRCNIFQSWYWIVIERKRARNEPESSQKWARNDPEMSLDHGVGLYSSVADICSKDSFHYINSRLYFVWNE